MYALIVKRWSVAEGVNLAERQAGTGMHVIFSVNGDVARGFLPFHGGDIFEEIHVPFRACIGFAGQRGYSCYAVYVRMLNDVVFM